MTGLHWLFRVSYYRKCNSFILFLISLLVVSPVDGLAQKSEVLFDSLRIIDEELSIDFHVDGLFDKTVLDGMDRGSTVEITYQIEIWRVRNNWFDEMVTSRVLRYKTGYNRFNRRYYWLNESGEYGPERLVTSSFEKIDQKCSVHKDIRFSRNSGLRVDNSYYIVVTGILEPLSVENLEEIRKLLSGEAGDLDLKENPEGSPRKLTGRFLTLIKNISGFGDRHYTGRSRDFVVTAGNTIRFIER